MITRIEARNFRSLRQVSTRLDSFQVLVGPNASGKTTFLDVVAFLGDLVSGGIEKAVGARTANFYDLTWRREGGSIDLAIEAVIPEERKSRLVIPDSDVVRYEISLDSSSGELVLTTEKVLLRSTANATERVSLEKNLDAEDSFSPEAVRENTNLYGTLDLGPRQSALKNLPEDESRWPVTVWLKHLLAQGVTLLNLTDRALRDPSPPGRGSTLRSDGSNLPQVVADLERRSTQRFEGWLSHVRTALPDLETVRVVEREEDRHSYLMLRYAGGFEIPSWVASEGTLRLLALTVLAYLPDLSGIYLIEEPENGIHPQAVETVFQSLSSVYDAQILLATHSPILLSLVEPEQLLCFSKDAEGATTIVAGNEHPVLKDWRGETSLSTLFAAGVLGHVG